MDVYAIIKTGGKQHRVAAGDIVKVEKLAVEPGATVQIDEVYLLVNDSGVTVGNPVVPNARVVAEVVEEGRDRKIVVFKMKRRKGYRRTSGHRQPYTLLRISEIVLGDTVYHPKASRRMAATPDAAATKPVAARRAAPTAPRIEPASPAVALPPAQPRPPPIPAPAAVAEARDQAPSTPPLIVPDENRTEAREPAAAPPQRPPEARTPEAVAPSASTTRTAPVPEPLAKRNTIEAPARHDRRYWVAAALAVLLLALIGLIFIGSRERTPQEPAPLAGPASEPIAPTEAVEPKPAPRDAAIREPAAVSAPSVPLQPPD